MRSFSQEIGRNWKSGVTVSLVSVPLSISLAIAAQATPLMGIITGVWAGLVAALLGGSRFNVTGPTGALSGILAMYAVTFGVGVLPLLAVGSGLTIFALYLLRWDRYIVFIPSSVTHGFTLGVAFIIGLNQLNFALGLQNLPPHESLPANVLESLRHLSVVNPTAIALFAVSFALLFLILRFAPRVPGPITVAAIGIVIGWLSQTGRIPFPVQTIFSRYGVLKASLIQWPSFTASMLSPRLINGCFAVALVAVLETLLSAKIADGMTKTKFDQKREMLGLSLANIVSGLCGGIPATAALARTSLNIKSGATSQTSALINGLSTALLSFVFFPQFQYLPLPVVAAILVYVAVRMVEGEHFVHLYRMDRLMFWLSLLVAAVTFFEDPIVGILVGSSAALLIFARQLSKGQSELSFHKNKRMIARASAAKLHEYEAKSDVTVCRFAGEMTYMNGQAHLGTVKNIRTPRTIILSLRNLYYIDIDGLDALHEILELCEQRGQKIVLTGIGEHVQPMLGRTPWYREHEKKGLVFDSTSEALRELGLGA